MKTISNQSFGGERPLFESHHLRLENVIITEGESGIKECSDIEADGCKFYGKYPFWHVKGSVITNCYFAPGSRSAIWYSDDMVMTDCVIDGPKFFREMKNLTLRDVKMYEFLEKLIRVALPRIRDFNGIAEKMDGQGNYTLGLKEQIIFPEIDIDKNPRIHGLEITFVTTARTDEECHALLAAFGLPFKKHNK